MHRTSGSGPNKTGLGTSPVEDSDGKSESGGCLPIVLIIVGLVLVLLYLANARGDTFDDCSTMPNGSVDCSNLDLGGLEFSDSDLEAVSLEGANFSGANLENVDFPERSLEGANFSAANLYRAKLDESGLRSVNFAGANLERADLSDSDLQLAIFTGANLEDTNLKRTELNRSMLEGVNFSGANLSRADLSRAQLDLVDFSRAKIHDADLSDMSLERADFTEAQLDRTNLAGTSLKGANLTRANLSGANLSGANLSGANLSGADLTGSIADTDTVWPRSIDPIAAGVTATTTTVRPPPKGFDLPPGDVIDRTATMIDYGQYEIHIKARNSGTKPAYYCIHMEFELPDNWEYQSDGNWQMRQEALFDRFWLTYGTDYAVPPDGQERVLILERRFDWWGMMFYKYYSGSFTAHIDKFEKLSSPCSSRYLG